MREIKFRAWDKKENKMLESITLKKLVTSGSLCNINDYENKSIMQYTGLKDKNNVEIYECDIVSIELDNNNYEIAEIKFNVKDGMYEVCFINSNTIEHFNDWIDITHFEIIGNIYENPELLK